MSSAALWIDCCLPSDFVKCHMLSILYSLFSVVCFHRQLIWQGTVCADLEDVDLDLSGRDIAKIVCSEVGYQIIVVPVIITSRSGTTPWKGLTCVDLVEDCKKATFTIKSRIQYAHLYNKHPKLSQENRGKTLV